MYQERAAKEELKRMKALQFAKDLATSKRNEKTRADKAQNKRDEQRAVWLARMAWTARMEREEKEHRACACAIYSNPSAHTIPSMVAVHV